jgi:archaemetzincin
MQVSADRRQFVRWAFAALASARHAEARVEGPPLIVLQPLGSSVEPAQLAVIAEAIGAFYRVTLRLSDPLPLPESAFYPKRCRYRAEQLLDFLAARAATDARVTLGLTSVDISTTKGSHEDWGILGLATLDGRSAVLSSFRCKRGAKNILHARTRMAKTAVHELGHSFGLDHCPTRGCIMHDGEGSVLTTDSERDLCQDTRARLTALGVLRPGAVSPFT